MIISNISNLEIYDGTYNQVIKSLISGWVFAEPKAPISIL